MNDKKNAKYKSELSFQSDITNEFLFKNERKIMMTLYYFELKTAFDT